MTDGFIKTAAGTIDVQVADVQTNTDTILARVRQADAAGVDLLTLPELCLTGYTCGDLFFSDCLLGQRRADPSAGQCPYIRIPAGSWIRPYAVPGRIQSKGIRRLPADG